MSYKIKYNTPNGLFRHKVEVETHKKAKDDNPYNKPTFSPLPFTILNLKKKKTIFLPTTFKVEFSAGLVEHIKQKMEKESGQSITVR